MPRGRYERLGLTPPIPAALPVPSAAAAAIAAAAKDTKRASGHSSTPNVAAFPAASADGGDPPFTAVEMAELFNSLGETLLEAKHYGCAAPTLEVARLSLETADDIDASSIASVEANEARMLSELGEEAHASSLFERCKRTTSHAALEATIAAQAPGGDANALIMVHILHARVLQVCPPPTHP